MGGSVYIYLNEAKVRVYSEVAIVGLVTSSSSHVDLDERVYAVERASLEDLLSGEAGEVNLHVAETRIGCQQIGTLLEIRLGALLLLLLWLLLLWLLLLLCRWQWLIQVLDIEHVVERSTEIVLVRLGGRGRIRRVVLGVWLSQQVPVAERVLGQRERELARVVHGVAVATRVIEQVSLTVVQSVVGELELATN